MKKILFSIVILFLHLSTIFAQISSGGKPPSFNQKRIKSANMPTYEISKINNLKALIDEDKLKPIPFRYSILNDVDIDIKRKGNVLIDEEGNKIWQYQISSEYAFSLTIIFKEYKLPKGAELFVYSPDKSIVFGAFTSKNNKNNGELCLQDLPGKEAVIEYFEPKDAEFEGELIVGKIGQAYKNIFNDLPDTAFIDVNCRAGDDWQLEKHAVTKLVFNDGQSGFLCSGFLVNNTNNDGEAFMITANHCISSTTEAKTLVTYFNYEKNDCQGITQLNPQTISEATILATNPQYDFTLLRLSEKPPPAYQPYYAGWNTAEQGPSHAISIHHPKGLEKKISVDYDTIFPRPVSYTLVDELGQTGDNPVEIPANAAWVVDFDRGMAVGGSSGSPLFDPDKRVIGILSAGDDFSSYYIRLNRAYKPYATTILEQLKHWLDPIGSNVSFLDGYIPNPDSIIPDAHFSSEYQGICLGSEIKFMDKTVFGANSWQWEIEPNSVTYIDGTDTSQNPIIKFNDPGKYTVTLTAKNEVGSDVQTRDKYISTEGLEIDIRQISLSSICTSEFGTVRVRATGAETYQWFVDDSIADFIELKNSDSDSLVINLNLDNIPIIVKDNSPDSLVTFKIHLEGSLDSCTVFSEFNVEMLLHNNDNIENAFPLDIDTLLGPFNNFCATVQENEPIPPVEDCTEQGEWCGCDLGNEYRFILGNSTWFTFIGPESGVVAIETFGYDNQIAVYEAESTDDILSGKRTRYTIIGASDDFSETDFSAKIPSLNVIPGKKYWIQSDGSGCNATGSFTIRVSSEAIVKAKKYFVANEKIVNIFPNPAKDLININKINSSEKLDIEIIDINGKIVSEKRMHENNLQIDLRNYTRGFYMIHVKSDTGIQISKLIVK